MIKRNARQQKAERGHNIRNCFLIFVCGMLLASGFFLAGRQHFSWMDYGMRNSKLRKQIAELQGEKRRLLLARETSLSPTEIKKAAKRFIATETPAQPAPEIASATKAKPPSTEPAAKAMVVKTVAVTPAPAVAASSYKKIDKAAKQIARVTTTAE